MTARGWDLQVQPARDDPRLPGPATGHVTVTPGLADGLDAFVAALGESAEAAARRGRVRVDPALTAAAGALDPAALDEAAVSGLLRSAGIGGGTGAAGLPERMAPLNALIGALPAPLVERLLVAVLAGVHRD
jgi:hypothetical protein